VFGGCVCVGERKDEMFVIYVEKRKKKKKKKKKNE
jgi:hypothetical protein